VKAVNNVPVDFKNFHELMRLRQAENMALSAGWTLTSALMRQESRGTHRRLDFPEQDDANWLKWIVIREEDGTDRFSTEEIPFEKYRLGP
jgi:succinate dehydrogenase/fumarate reductase flavoprotein subunit